MIATKMMMERRKTWLWSFHWEWQRFERLVTATNTLNKFNWVNASLGGSDIKQNCHNESCLTWLRDRLEVKVRRPITSQRNLRWAHFPLPLPNKFWIWGPVPERSDWSCFASSALCVRVQFSSGPNFIPLLMVHANRFGYVLSPTNASNGNVELAVLAYASLEIKQVVERQREAS